MLENIDLNTLPLGTILPFSAAEPELPEEWIEFDGRVLDARDYPDLYKRLWPRLDIWERIGGEMTALTITLPNVETPEQAMELTFGYHSDPPMDITLAIKAKRNGNVPEVTE